MTQSAPLFHELNSDNVAEEATEIESCCMNCYKNGTTRLLLTMIPFYKEVVIMSFSCDHCGFANNELQSGGTIEPKGVRITLNVLDANDLNRKVVKSDYSSVKFVEIDFEIEAQSQKGEITTVEGIIDRAIAGLEQDQPSRRIDHPDDAEKIENFIEVLRQLKSVEKPFTIQFEDISGNCYVENTHAPHPDTESTSVHFIRTLEQDHQLGLYTQDELNANNDESAAPPTKKNTALLHPIAEDEWPLQELHGEVLQFSTLCPECKAPCETNMKLTSIPHFKDVVIMATYCESCGNKTNEVKSGAGIEEQGVRFEVSIACTDDMCRDVLKSESCNIFIPELDCDVGSYALGGKFTTIEGILDSMKNQLSEGGFHDSEDVDTKKRINRFVDELDKVIQGERKITLILDDPAGNSYVQSLNDDGSVDDRLKISKYDRTYEQNDELGINDMKTENY